MELCARPPALATAEGSPRGTASLAVLRVFRAFARFGGQGPAVAGRYVETSSEGQERSCSSLERGPGRR